VAVDAIAACGDGRLASPSQRVRFQEPCVLFFAGVDIHSRETPVAIVPRFMVIATEPNQD